MKNNSLIVSGVLAGSLALAGLSATAQAGPYVNVENSAGFTGSDFNGSVTDAHVGYEGGEGVYGFYLQGGPARQASCPHPGGSEAQQSFVPIKVPNLDILDFSHRLSRPSPNHGVEWLHWLSWHRTGHSRNSWKISCFEFDCHFNKTYTSIN